MLDLNYLAILMSAIAAMALGAMWYGPLFGKMWIALSGMSQKDLEEAKKNGMGKSYAINFIGQLVFAGVTALMIWGVGTETLSGSLWLAFWLWLGYIATTMLNSVLWEKKSWKLYFLNTGYQLVALLLVTSILTVWS